MSPAEHDALVPAASTAPAPLTTEAKAAVEGETHYLNFGPQHPAAHGVLRLILERSLDEAVFEQRGDHEERQQDRQARQRHLHDEGDADLPGQAMGHRNTPGSELGLV